MQAQILDLLQRLSADRGMAIILISHDLGVVAGRADEVAVMYAGKIVERGPARTVLEHPLMPYTEALLHSVPLLANPSHTKLQVIGGRPPDLVKPPQGCRFHPRCPRAGTRCSIYEPALVPDAADDAHSYACWYPVGSPSGPEAERAGAVPA